MASTTNDISLEVMDSEQELGLPNDNSSSEPNSMPDLTKPVNCDVTAPVNCDQDNIDPTDGTLVAESPTDQLVVKPGKINMDVVDNSTRERISSRGMDTAAFNRSVANFRKTMVKNMLRSSYQNVESTFAEQQRVQEEALRKDLEAAQKARESLRRQLERGQEMEEVQKAAINYETALRNAANDDEEMAKKLLTMFASMHRAKAKYNKSLQFRLDGRYGYATKEDW